MADINVTETAKVVELLNATDVYVFTVPAGVHRPLDVVCRQENLAIHWQIKKEGDSNGTVLHSGIFSATDAVRRTEVTLYQTGTYKITPSDATTLINVA